MQRYVLMLVCVVTASMPVNACTRAETSAASTESVSAATSVATPAGTPSRAVTIDAQRQKAGGIEVVVVHAETWPEVVEAPGVLRLDDRRTARLGAQVDAVVHAVAANVGDSVAAGEMVAALRSHETHDAWADYRKAHAEVRRLTSELGFATDGRDRARRLLDAKAIPAHDLKRAEADVTARAELLTAARAEVRRAAEELEHLGLSPNTGLEQEHEHERDVIPVRAPHAGQIIERLVTPGTTVTSGQPLVVVSDLTRLWLVAEVDERILRHLTIEQAISVSVSAYPDETFPATVAAIGDTIDPRTRRVQIRCEVPNPARRLKPEMFALVRVTAAERHVIALPADAVQTVDGRAVVFVQTADTEFEPRAVVAGAASNGRVPVTDGLSAGDRVVSRGAFLLKSQMRQAAE